MEKMDRVSRRNPGCNNPRQTPVSLEKKMPKCAENDYVSDEEFFGEDAIVYCKSHLRPHRTGWCTVHNEDKILLDAKTIDEAEQECNDKGLYRYNPSGWA